MLLRGQPSDIPYFTGSTYSQLAGMDPTAPLTVTWNNFAPAPEINSAPIFFTVFRVSDGQTAVSTVVSNSVASFQIPANALASNTEYKASLDFSSRIDTLDAGFIDADSSVLFDSITEIQFTTGSHLAGDHNRDQTVDAADYVVWRNTDGMEEGYDAWRNNFGRSGVGGSGAGVNATVPEPATLVMLVMAAVGIRLRRRNTA